MKQKITLILYILIFPFSSVHAQKWLWGAEGNSLSDTYGVAAGNSGNAYLAGAFDTAISFGNQSLNSLSTDAFLVKYDTGGNVLWARQSKSLNDSSFCAGIYICTDNEENIYYTGYFNGVVCFGIDTLHDIRSEYDVFLVKYDSNGHVLWAKQSTSNDYNNFYDVGLAIATDDSKNIFVTGVYADTLSFGPYTISDSSGNSDVFLVKYDSNGNVRWVMGSKCKGLTNGGVESSVCLDDSGNAYIAGFFYNTISFGPYNLSTNYAGAFLVKYDNNGNIRWAVEPNTHSVYSECYAYGVISDAGGNVYITGSFTDTVSFGPYRLINDHAAYGQLFLVKYTPDGKVIWAKQSQGDQLTGYSFAKDKINHLYLSGGNSFYQSNYTTIFDNDTLMLQDVSPNDPSVIFKLDTAGNLLCGSVIVTGGDDQNGVACSSSGDFVYLGGDIYKPVTFGNNYLSVAKGTEYPFIARWQPCCSAPVSLTGNSSLCKGFGEVLYTSGGGSYSWSTGSTNDSIIINPDATTTYSVSIENAGCTYLISKTVGVSSEPIVTLCCDTLIQDGENVQLTSGGGAFYVWSPATGLNCDTCSNPIADPSKTTTYTLTVMNDSGCISTRTITIDVKCGQVFIPDIFSPNQHVNNIFYVRGSCISVLDFMIFDRWGNKVYETHNKDNGWDGTYGGHPMNTGTYMYYAKATMYDGSVVEKKGSVTLVR